MIILAIAFAALWLAYSHYAQPVIEKWESAAQDELLERRIDAGEVSNIKSDPKAFDEKAKAAAAELGGYKKRTGLLPSAAEIAILEKVAAVGIAPEAVDIMPGEAGVGSEAGTVAPAVGADAAGSQAGAGIANGTGAAVIELQAQGYMITVRAKYAEGIALMKAFENVGAGTWSVYSFTYSQDGGGVWTLGVRLHYGVKR
jgi:hypothetical protein